MPHAHFTANHPAFPLDGHVDLSAKMVRSDSGFDRLSKLHRGDDWDIWVRSKEDGLLSLWESLRDDAPSKWALERVREYDQAGFAAIDRDRARVNISLYLAPKQADRLRDLCAQMKSFCSNYVASLSISFSEFRGDQAEVKHGPTLEEFSNGAFLTVILSSFRTVSADIGAGA
jgi:hypothetical protein